MKITSKLLLLILIIFTISIIPESLPGSPFISIDKIDDSQFPKIGVYLTVRNQDKAVVNGLDENNLLLYEDGYLVNYLRIKELTGAEAYLYIVISIDSSKSISSETLKEIKNSARQFISASGDVLSLYKFNDYVTLLDNFSEKHNNLLMHVDSIERHGKKTLLYNALYDSIDLLNRKKASRKAVVAFTDGKDEGSSIEADDIIKFAKDTNTPVYFIAYNPGDRKNILSRLAVMTGGRLFELKETAIDAIYSTIKTGIENHYIAEYTTMIEPDGKSHTIEARLKYDNLRDRELKEFVFNIKKNGFVFHIDYEKAIIALLILIVLLLLIIVLLFSFRKRKSKNIYQKNMIIPADENGVERDLEEKPAEQQPEKKEEADNIIPGKAWLVERDGKNAGRKFQIKFRETGIGKGKDNQIIMDDKSVANNHIKIKFIENSFYIFDLASGKETYLNEKKLLRPKLLYDWDEIKIGKSVFIFRMSGNV